MPIIVKIGYRDFLVKNEAAATKILVALCGAIALNRTYEGEADKYWPAESGPENRIAIETISARQILPGNPKKAKPVVNCRLELGEGDAQ